MHLFTVKSIHCPDEVLGWWYDMGFRPALPEDETGPSGLPASPDVCMSFHPSASWWQGVQEALPRCFVVRTAGQTDIPPDVGKIYDVCARQLGVHEWLFGSKMAEMVKLSNQGAAPNEREQVRRVAEAVYQALLKDTFRETAEWCGHMSSVVRPLQ